MKNRVKIKIRNTYKIFKKDEWHKNIKKEKETNKQYSHEFCYQRDLVVSLAKI